MGGEEEAAILPGRCPEPCFFFLICKMGRGCDQDKHVIRKQSAMGL